MVNRAGDSSSAGAQRNKNAVSPGSAGVRVRSELRTKKPPAKPGAVGIVASSTTVTLLSSTGDNENGRNQQQSGSRFWNRSDNNVIQAALPIRALSGLNGGHSEVNRRLVIERRHGT